MSEIRLTSEKKLRIFSGRGYPELAEEVATELGIPITPTSAYDFANGEIFVRFEESVRGCDAFVIQSHAAPVNKQIMEQLIMVDALKRASAKRITVVAPFYGYARQDKKHRGREPISARLMADLYKTAGADRLMVVDLHTSQIQGFFDGPVDHLFALPMLANYVGSKVDRSMLTIVSPDSGRVRVAERWSELLGGCPIAFIHKTRDPLIPNESVTGRVVGDVTGRTCVVIDDMIDTAGTITKAVDALFEGGAKDVIVAATHAVFSGPAVDRLMVVDLHTSQIQGFFDGPVDHLFALPMLANYVGSKVDRSMLTIVSPDSGRVRVAERWSELLGGCPIAFIHKTRDPLIPNESVTGRVVGDVTGRTCVVIDDMIDTAGTITKAVDALFEGGAKDVIVAATHAVFSGPAVDRLKECRAVEVVVTNSLPIADDKHFDKLTVLSIAPLLGRAIREVFEDGSVTSLFDGHS